MNPSLLVVALLVVAALIGAWRSWRMPARWRWLRVSAQFVSAVLLYLLLYPPMVPLPGELRVVLTPGVTAEQIRSLDPAHPAIVLPGVEIEDALAEHFPDLASALRRYPQVDRLQILGSGLPLRDRESTQGLGISFEPAALSAGIVDAQWSDSIVAGSIWSLHGGIAPAAADVRIELRDRAGALVAKSSTDAQGRFALDAGAAAAVPSLYRLRAIGSDDALIEDFPLAVDVRDALPAQVLLLAGAPDAELKYLRRWAADAKIALGSRIALSRGISFRDSEVALDAATLATTDLLIVDERAWAVLGGPAKSAIIEAVGQGLGLMLRVTGEIPKAVASDWASLGFRLESAEIASSIESALVPGMQISRRALKIIGPGSTSLLQASDGSDLARWRNDGLGRIALWLPLDSYRIALAGDQARYASLWSSAFASIARARGESPAQLPTFSWVNERSRFWAIHDDAAVEDPAGVRYALHVVDGCAAYWPASAGWHVLVDGGTRRPFFVFANGEARALAAAQTTRATQELVRAEPTMRTNMASKIGPRWPFFLVWLTVTAMLWWFERKASRDTR